jgi:hypothetical protein
LPLWSQKEYGVIDNVFRAGVITSSIIVLVVALYWTCDESRRKGFYLLTMFIIHMTIGAVAFLAPIFNDSSSDGFSTFLCLNNAVPRHQRDGVSLCVIEAVLFHYSSLGVSLAWSCQALDLYLRVVVGRRPTHLGKRKLILSPYFWLHVIFIFGLPGVIVGYALSRGLYGYAGSQAWCAFHDQVSTAENLLTLQLPVLITVIPGFFLLLGSLYKIAMIGTGPIVLCCPSSMSLIMLKVFYKHDVAIVDDPFVQQYIELLRSRRRMNFFSPFRILSLPSVFAMAPPGSEFALARAEQVGVGGESSSKPMAGVDGLIEVGGVRNQGRSSVDTAGAGGLGAVVGTSRNILHHRGEGDEQDGRSAEPSAGGAGREGHPTRPDYQLIRNLLDDDPIFPTSEADGFNFYLPKTTPLERPLSEDPSNDIGPVPLAPITPRRSSRTESQRSQMQVLRDDVLPMIPQQSVAYHRHSQHNVEVHEPVGGPHFIRGGNDRRRLLTNSLNFRSRQILLQRATTAIILFMVMHLVLTFFLISYRVYVSLRLAAQSQSLNNWALCRFQYFQGEDPDGNCLSHCGEHPSYRVPFTAAMLGFIAVGFYGAFISAMHFSAMMRKFSPSSIYRIVRRMLVLLWLTATGRHNSANSGQ